MTETKLLVNNGVTFYNGFLTCHCDSGYNLKIGDDGKEIWCDPGEDTCQGKLCMPSCMVYGQIIRQWMLIACTYNSVPNTSPQQPPGDLGLSPDSKVSFHSPRPICENCDYDP